MKPLQIRVARPTDRLDAVVAFYRDALGLREIGSFQGHAGYDGVMLGMPDASVHLEFTAHRDGSPCPVPTRDNLLVLYLGDGRDAVAARLIAAGHRPVEPENPHWRANGLTFEDPDGWRVVLMATPGL